MMMSSSSSLREGLRESNISRKLSLHIEYALSPSTRIIGGGGGGACLLSWTTQVHRAQSKFLFKESLVNPF